MQWSNALDQRSDWSEYDRDEKEDERNLADTADQRTVGGLIQPHQIIIWGLLGGVARTVLGLEVLDAEHIVSSGDVWKQGCDDERDADNVEPAGL